MVYKKSEKELKEDLITQVKFIKNSQESFDSGFHGEAQRLATTIRVLLHATRSSLSLLKQLDKKKIHFLSTTQPFIPVNLVPYTPFMSMNINDREGSYELIDIQDESVNVK